MGFLMGFIFSYKQKHKQKIPSTIFGSSRIWDGILDGICRGGQFEGMGFLGFLSSI